MYLDKNGLIISKFGEGRDTLQLEGTYFFATGTLVPKQASYIGAISLLQHNGVWVRNPDVYNDINDVGREEMDPNIICLGTYKHSLYPKIVLMDTFKEQCKRLMFYQNYEPPSLLTFSLYIRAFRAWWLYPLLLVFDLGFLACAVASFVERDAQDDTNRVMRFLQALYLPTPWSYIGRKLYARSRRGYHLRLGDNSEATDAFVSLMLNYFKL